MFVRFVASIFQNIRKAFERLFERDDAEVSEGGSEGVARRRQRRRTRKVASKPAPDSGPSPTSPAAAQRRSKKAKKVKQARSLMTSEHRVNRWMRDDLSPLLCAIESSHGVTVSAPADFQGKVVVSGPPDAVKVAAEEVEESIRLVRKWREDRREAAVAERQGFLSVDERFHAALIGKHGQVKASLQAQTGCKIFVPQKGAKATAIRIEGTSKSQIDACKAAMMRIVDQKKVSEERFLEREAARERRRRLVVRSLDVPAALHGVIIGCNGSTIDSLRREFGCDISVPLKTSNSQSVTVTGLDEARVDACVSHIDKIVERNTSETFEVPKHLHSVIIGPNGQNIRSLSERFNGSVFVPARGSTSTFIRVRAESHGLRAALRDEILKLVMRRR